MSETKFNQLLLVSNPKEVDRRAKEFYDKPVYMSNRKNKKYMIENDDNKFIHFGDIRYQDYTFHKDAIRAMSYRKRMNGVKGNWKNDEYSPNILSLRLLW